MFVILRDVSAAKKVIATLLATALILWASGAFNVVRAANITNVKDTISDSAPAANSNHSFEFIAPSGVGAGTSIVITFPAGFDLTGVTEDDVDLAVDGVDELTQAGAASGATWGVSFGASTITFTSGTATIGGTASITIEVGTNATSDGTGANQINNPTPVDGNESFEISISAGASDSGYTRVVILDTVLVTARINTTFDFTVSGNATGTTVNGTSTTGTSGSTTIPFGLLTAYQIKTLSQDLQVQTNARNGFVVTVEADGPFDSSTGADIDNFANGTINDASPVAWSSPTNLIADERTWGHWGITSEDTDTNGRRTAEFGSNQWVGVGTSSAPTVVFAHDGPADNTTPGIGSTTVGYQVEITPLQEAGDDYQTILTYIATPTF